MRVQEVKRAVQLQEWAAQIQAREKSGLTVKQWCAENGPSLKTYYYRQHRVREELLGCITSGNAIQISAMANTTDNDSSNPTTNAMVCREEATTLLSTGFAEVKLAQSVAHVPNSGQEQVWIEFSGVRLSASAGYPIENLAALLREARVQC